MRDINGNKCEHCGYVHTDNAPVHHLIPGIVLNNRYLVGNSIGEGGFGITYIGRDTNLDIRVAIKEYFPHGYANRYSSSSINVTATVKNNTDYYSKGKTRFLQEARVLAKFSGEKNIVTVRDFFEENNTAYIVMEYIDGVTLKEELKSRKRFDFDDLFEPLVPLLRALGKIHNQGLIHRDISPDNIMIMDDGTLKLMDFGSARGSNFDTENSLSIVLKPGYAPEEQYRSKGKQGPWTDIYAICATIYKCITGVTPDNSVERLYSDDLKIPSELGAEILPEQEAVIMHGMAINAKDRYQSVEEFLSALGVKEKKSRTITITRKKLDIESEDSMESISVEQKKKDIAQITVHSNEILKIVSSDEDSSEDTLVSYDEDTVLLIEDDDTTPLPIDEESEEKCLFEDDYEGTRLLIEDEVEVEEISYVAEDADEESTKLIDETEEAIIQKKDTEPKESNVDNCSTHNYLISESDSVTVSESNNTKLAEDEWKCPKCGKIHYNYVGTCGCGESKPANSSMYFAQNPTKKSKQTSLPTNKEWKCPKCGRINSYYVGTCGCGETRPANIDPFILSEIQYEQHLSPQYNHNERKDKQTRPTRPLQANEWRCPKCGKIHYYYVGTCGCGERRPSSI